MKTIAVNDFVTRVNDLWDKQWFLLTAGNYETGHFNTMTVAWGYFGIMWGMPAAAVVVRPTRYTFEFINKYDTFTLSSFDKKYKKDLLLLGTESGRDGDKIAKTNLNITASKKVSAPYFKEAKLVLECRKIYWDDFKPENFLDKSIDEKYPEKDYHRIFYGEILEIRGTDEFKK